MAALTRKFKKIFGKDSSNNGVFGSAAALAPATSTNPETIESLPAFLNGWSDATEGGLKLPTLEDTQGLKYDTDYHLAYMYQEGIPEYNSLTEYQQHSIIKKTETTQLYRSLTNLNTGNPLTDNTKWALCGDLQFLPTSAPLLASNNLSDLTSVSAAGVNLGLGTTAYISGTTAINTFLQTPSSANFSNALTDESGSGVVQFGGQNWTTFTPTFTGFSVNPTVDARYLKIGKVCFIQIYTTNVGTSNSTSLTITNLPFTSGGGTMTTPCFVLDNGSASFGMAVVNSSSSVLQVFKGANLGGNVFTASGSKYVNISFAYETAS